MKTLSITAGNTSLECKRIGCDYWKQLVSEERGLSEKLVLKSRGCACVHAN